MFRRLPTGDGLQCAGTRPFMAIDLFAEVEVGVEQRYRHDVEGFI